MYLLRLAETLKVDKDHTFGTIVKPDNLSELN